VFSDVFGDSKLDVRFNVEQTQEQNIRYKREHRAMATEERERERERRRNKKVKETNERRIDIKEATRGDDARRHGVPNSRSRFPFQKIREKSERIEEARGMVMSRRCTAEARIHTRTHCTQMHAVYQRMERGKSGSEIEAQRVERKMEKETLLPVPDTAY